MRNEEEEERLGEMTEDPDNGEDYSGVVAVGVADENLGWVFVVRPDGKRDSEEREEHVEREQV